MASPSVLRSTAGRAVHLRITPRPANLAESREVLRLISQFGEVEYFKNLKYDTLSHPQSAFVIFRDQEAAASCMRRGPIRFRMGSGLLRTDSIEDQAPQPQQSKQGHDEQGDPKVPETHALDQRSAFGLGQRRLMSTSAVQQSPMDSFPFPMLTPSYPALDSRIFQIQTNPARVNFRDQISTGHYHGTFLTNTKGIAQKALSKSVPIKGLSCVNWRAEEKPWRLVQREKRVDSHGMPGGKTLREIYDEGLTSSKATRNEGLQ